MKDIRVKPAKNAWESNRTFWWSSQTWQSDSVLLSICSSTLIDLGWWISKQQQTMRLFKNSSLKGFNCWSYGSKLFYFFRTWPKTCRLWWGLAFELRWCNSGTVPATAGDVTLTRLHSSIFGTTCHAEPVCIRLNFQATADRVDCKWLLPAQVGLSRPSCWDLSRHWDSYRRDSMRLQLTSHQRGSTYDNLHGPVKKQYSLVSFNCFLMFDSVLMMLNRTLHIMSSWSVKIFII